MSSPVRSQLKTPLPNCLRCTAGLILDEPTYHRKCRQHRLRCCRRLAPPAAARMGRIRERNHRTAIAQRCRHESPNAHRLICLAHREHPRIRRFTPAVAREQQDTTQGGESERGELRARRCHSIAGPLSKARSFGSELRDRIGCGGHRPNKNSKIRSDFTVYSDTSLGTKARAARRELRDSSRDGLRNSSVGWRDRNSRR